MIQNNVIHQSYIHGLKKILFLGSSCIYPKLAPQPLKEEYLLTGFFTEEISVDSLVATIIKFLNNYTMSTDSAKQDKELASWTASKLANFLDIYADTTPNKL